MRERRQRRLTDMHKTCIGPVHTNPNIFENGGFFRPQVTGVFSLRKIFEYALQNLDFLRRRQIMFVWTGEKGGFLYDDVTGWCYF